MADTENLQKPFKEFLSRIEEDDQGVPHRHGDFLITTPKSKKGKPLPNLLSKVFRKKTPQKKFSLM